MAMERRDMKDSEGLRPAPGEIGRDPYDPLSRALHWTTAVLVLATFVLSLWPGLVEGSGALHRSLGLALLFVVLLRLGWRLTAGWGGARPGGAGVGGFAAKAVHSMLYAMLLAVPLLGWLHLNSKGIGASMFGLHLPMLADADRELAPVLLQAKRWLSYGMLVVIGLHAAAALAHHYLLRDDVLASMMPNGFRGHGTATPQLAPAVVAGAAGTKGVA
jgi:superoxide oxidase